MREAFGDDGSVGEVVAGDCEVFVQGFLDLVLSGLRAMPGIALAPSREGRCKGSIRPHRRCNCLPLQPERQFKAICLKD